MSVKVRAQIHPIKKEYTEFSCAAAPLSELYANLKLPLDITHARFLIDDEIVKNDFDRVPPDGSTVYIAVALEGSPQETGKAGFILGAVLFIVGAAISIATLGMGSPLGSLFIGSGLSLMLGGYILANVEIPNPPNLGRDTGAQMESIRGSKNRERRLEFVPVLFGRHLITPDVAALSYTEIDTSGQQWLIQLFCAGYNDMVPEKNSFKVGDTALVELSETHDIDAILAGTDGKVKLEILQNGESSALYPQICVEQQFNTVLKHNDTDGTPVNITHTTADKTTRINADIIFPMGLIRYDDDGDKHSASVSVSIQYKNENDPDEMYTDFPGWNRSISATTVDMFRRQAVVSGLAPGKYTVKITRLTADSGDSQTINTVYAGSIRAYADDRPVRQEAAENLTIIALKIRASALASGIIDNFNLVAQSLISDYSPSGSAWTPNLTKNPASMLLYVLQGKINPAPVADADIDWDSLREFWIFCYQKGYTCNAVQGGRELFSVLCAKVAKTGRASVLRINGKFSVVVDKERPAPVQLFSPRNTIGYSQTLVKADIPDELAVEFIDETTGWASNERSVYNTPDGLPEGEEKTKQTSRIWGITDPDIIFKFTRYQYACIKNRPIIHTLECDIEYLLCKKGDLIEYAGDTALTGIAYGKVTGLIQDGALVAGIVVDTVFPQEAGQNYGIRCRKSNGALITLEVTNRQTKDKTAFFEIAQNEGVLEEGDLIVFGLTGKITRQLVVNEITPADNFRATLSCVDYAPEIFNVDDPEYVVPPFDNKITTAGSIVDSGIVNPGEWQTWFAYHDETEMPEKPTDSGTAGGWHRYPTPQSRWVSQKTARNITDGEWSNPTQTSFQIINKIITERPTYTEIVEGFTQAGVTVVPHQLTVSASGGLRFIALSWAKQTSLSNLKEYQLQVSEDAVAWYAPRFDGLGPEAAPWRGSENAVFATAATMIVHPNIPPAGTGEAPAGRMLYYRVRQRTMVDQYSDWSAVVGAETKLTDTGDYGVNSISANALKAAELLAMFAKLSESLVVDPRFGISSENAAWADGDTRAILNARQIAFQYFLDTVWATMARFGLEGVEAAQIYSPDKLFITNADMRSRRSRGYDVGAPLPSAASRVAHLDVHEDLSVQGTDTYILDQQGENFLLVTGTGSLEGEAEGIPLILKAVAPYATETRALHGNFRLQGTFSVNGAWTLDFWFFYYWNESQVLFKVGNDAELLQLSVQNAEPYLNDEPTDGVWLNDEPTDDVWLNEIKDAGTSILHSFQGTSDVIDLGPDELASEKWYHLGVINNGATLKLLVNNKTWTWESQTPPASLALDINPAAGDLDGEFNRIMVDEIMFDPGAAEDTVLFAQNNLLKRPWGRLDDAYPWAIINIKDPAYFRTNLFQGPDLAPAVLSLFQKPDFAAAVAALLNGGSNG
jgi:hypothetical protein